MIQTQSLSQQVLTGFEDSATSLASLQRQITSLAQVTLQNHCTLELLMADKGGTCFFLREECCYYINESGLVETRVQSLHKLSDEIRRYNITLTDTPGWWNSPVKHSHPTDWTPNNYLPLSASATLSLSIFPEPPTPINSGNLQPDDAPGS
jgi:hypothetical protein